MVNKYKKNKISKRKLYPQSRMERRMTLNHENQVQLLIGEQQVSKWLTEQDLRSCGRRSFASSNLVLLIACSSMVEYATDIRVKGVQFSPGIQAVPNRIKGPAQNRVSQDLVSSTLTCLIGVRSTVGQSVYIRSMGVRFSHAKYGIN